jgi:hypothetical protein
VADLAPRKTLRSWPWLVMCGFGAVLFSLLAWFAGFVAAGAEGATTLVVALLFLLGLAALAVYSLASLRIRTVLDPSGSTARSAFSSTHVPWSQVQRLDVTHSLPGWAVRAWTVDDEAKIVYMCHDTHGSRKQMARSYERPPIEAPRAVQRGFETIESYWHNSGQVHNTAVEQS